MSTCMHRHTPTHTSAHGRIETYAGQRTHREVAARPSQRAVSARRARWPPSTDSGSARGCKSEACALNLAPATTRALPVRTSGHSAATTSRGGAGENRRAPCTRGPCRGTSAPLVRRQATKVGCRPPVVTRDTAAAFNCAANASRNASTSLGSCECVERGGGEVTHVQAGRGKRRAGHLFSIRLVAPPWPLAATD